MVHRESSRGRLGAAVGLYAALCPLVGLGNLISALGRGNEALDILKGLLVPLGGAAWRFRCFQRGGHVSSRVLVGIVLLVLLAGMWACLWVPPMPR